MAQEDLQEDLTDPLEMGVYSMAAPSRRESKTRGLASLSKN